MRLPILFLFITLLGCNGDSERDSEIVRAVRNMGGSAHTYSSEELEKSKLSRSLRGTLGSIHLERLDLSNVDLKPLLPLDSLAICMFHGSNVTDEQVALLRDCKRLELLGLDSTPITDSALKAIADIESLEILYLNRCNITDAGLKALEGHPSLEEVRLVDTHVTADGIDALQKRSPNKIDVRLWSTAPSPEVREALREMEHLGADVSGTWQSKLDAKPDVTRYRINLNSKWKGSAEKTTSLVETIARGGKTAVRLNNAPPEIAEAIEAVGKRDVELTIE
jgi:hypothetical protein